MDPWIVSLLTIAGNQLHPLHYLHVHVNAIRRDFRRESTWQHSRSVTVLRLYLPKSYPATGAGGGSEESKGKGRFGRSVDSSPSVGCRRGGGRKLDVGRWMKQADSEEKKEGVIRMVRKRWRGVAPYFYTVWPLLCIIPHLARSSRDAGSRYADLSAPR